MKRRIFGFLLLMLGVLCGVSGSAEQIQLIKDGSTDYSIIIGPGASPVETFAAQELQGYVMQMSGVFLPMARGDFREVGKLILLGGEAAARVGLKLNESRMGPDGFVIRTIGDRLILAGGSSRGTLYSVYAFLEMLGCRWPAPGILGETIPQTPNISFAQIHHSEGPKLTYRGFTNSLPVTYESAQWIDWMCKNRMNYLLIHQRNYADFKEILGGELEKRGIYSGVSFDRFTSEDDEIAATGREADRILDFIARNPEVDIIGIRTDPPVTDDPDMQRTGSITGVLEMLREHFPGKLVTIMTPGGSMPDTGYSASSAQYPMSERCYRHHLGDDECEINSRVRSHLEGQLRSWGRTHIHEYYMGSYSQNSLPFPILHTIASDIRYLGKQDEVEGIISQCEPANWGAYGLNYYVFARMAWDAEYDLGSIVDDYCEKYYGPASGPMKRYFAQLENVMASMKHFRFVDPPDLILTLLDESSLTELEVQIQKAISLSNDAMIFDRIVKTKLSLEHARLLWNTLYHYSRAIQLQKADDHEGARDHFQKAAQLGEELVAFLFQNADEGVFIIPESYIFDYLEPLIIDARDRKESSGVE